MAFFEGLKAEYNRAGGNVFGGFGDTLGYFSGDYLKSAGEGFADGFWGAPRAAVKGSIINPTRHAIQATLPELGASLGSFRTELIENALKPIAFTVGHIRKKVFDNLEIDKPASWFSSLWGIATTPVAFFSGGMSAILSYPGDLLALGPKLVGATTKTIGNFGKNVFTSTEMFGDGMLETGDYIERATDRVLLAPGMQEGASYGFITS